MQVNTDSPRVAVEKALADFWLPNLIACEDIGLHLAYVDASDKSIRAGALRRGLEAFDDRLAEEIPEGWRVREYRRRTIVTLLGEVTYMRRIYVEPSGVCHALLDEVTGIRTRFKLAPDAFLWVARTAAEVSYRKTARAFHERTGAEISHWLVMSVVHEEGDLLLADLYDRALAGAGTGMAPWASETLFVEYDGLHVHLQKESHQQKVPRWLYERGRRPRTLEMKNAVFYMGKDAAGRRRGACHMSLSAPPEEFFSLLGGYVSSEYDTSLVSSLTTASDAAGWCVGGDLGLTLAEGAAAGHRIDPWHVNREIRRAVPDREVAGQLIRLVADGSVGEALGRLGRMAASGDDDGRLASLSAYLSSVAGMLGGGDGPSLGTMEGTNAKVYAARMKAWGGAWSARGAAAMCAIRARIATGGPLIAPGPDNVRYGDGQARRRALYDERSRTWPYDVPLSEGSGYEPPQGSIILSTRMPGSLYGTINFAT